MTLPRLVLAIESAVAGGSLSLIRDGKEIANWIGTAEVSKGEDLLFNIDAMLRSAGTPKRDLELIAVSAGPGSFTGIRIGLATALGLKNGLGISMASRSILKAMVMAEGQPGPRVIAAVPMGGKAFCYQGFEIGDRALTETDEPKTAPAATVADLIRNDQEATFLLHSALFHFVADEPRAIDAGTNLATALGLDCFANAEPSEVEPLFISKSF
jgi:tRNA threonylcarbamoyl adenosine modification protein YeaZ